MYFIPIVSMGNEGKQDTEKTRNMLLRFTGRIAYRANFVHSKLVLGMVSEKSNLYRLQMTSEMILICYVSF